MTIETIMARLTEKEEIKQEDYPEMVDFAETPVVVGTLRAVRTDVGEYNSRVYTIEDESGVKTAFWGSAAIDSQMDKESAAVGDLVAVHYLGVQKSANGRNYHNYVVAVERVEA